jgi:hypothetical protein
VSLDVAVVANRLFGDCLIMTWKGDPQPFPTVVVSFTIPVQESSDCSYGDAPTGNSGINSSFQTTATTTPCPANTGGTNVTWFTFSRSGVGLTVFP